MPSGVPTSTVETGTPSAFASLRRGQRRDAAAVARSVRDHELGGRRHDAVDDLLLLAEPRRGQNRVADRRSLAGAQLRELLPHEVAVGGRRHGDDRAAAERDERDAVLLRDLVQELVGLGDRREQARRRHVLRLHRARGVDHEHDRGVVARHGERRVRLRHPDQQRAEPEHEQHRRDEAQPPRRALHERRQQRRRGEALALGLASPLERAPDEHRQRHEQRVRAATRDGRSSPGAAPALQEDGERAQPVALGREDGVRHAERREHARDAAPLLGGGGSEALAQRCAARVDAHLAARSPGRRATPRPRREAPARAGRGSRARARRGEAEAAAAAAASRAGRGSRRPRRRARAAARRAPARASAAPTEVAPPPSSSGSSCSAVSRPSSPCRP